MPWHKILMGFIQKIGICFKEPIFYECICVTELTDFTGFTWAAPSSSQCGAALRLQGGSVDVDLTAVVLYCQPASTLHTVCGAKVTANRTWLKGPCGLFSAFPTKLFCASSGRNSERISFHIKHLESNFHWILFTTRSQNLTMATKQTTEAANMSP